ncbi:MAG TPA: hypothetical protein VNG51_18125 [Ktedonobacteraceae bacterium]|nr:hypothetical protein [Ktedonobacteraceae bacterium]
MSNTGKEPLDGMAHTQLPKTNLLNVSQQRALAITLRRLELATWRLEEQLTREATPQLTLTHVTNHLTAQQQAQLLRLASAIREEIAQLAVDYAVASEERNLIRTIASEFTLLWCDLEEIRPSHLKNYGYLNPQVNTILGPHIQHLIDLTLTMNHVACDQDRTATGQTIGTNKNKREAM